MLIIMMAVVGFTQTALLSYLLLLLLDSKKMAALLEEERHIKQENLRLHRKLQMETDRREALCRHLSESESSLEMDDER